MNIPRPIRFYTAENDSPLLFHVIDVEQGLMMLIVFPDQTTMIYDCNIMEGNKDKVIDYLRTNIPWRIDPESKESLQWIDIFVNSHRDRDHYRGLREIVSEFGGRKIGIKSIWDSGESGATTDDDDYQYYMDLRRRLVEKYGENAVVVPAPSLIPLRNFGGATVYCLCSSRDFLSERMVMSYGEHFLLEEASTIKEAKIQHTNAIVLSISYGNRNLLLTSDSDYIAWRDKIVPQFSQFGRLKSDILIASHHGSRSFFTDPQLNEVIDCKKNPESTYIDSIDFIDPAIVLISCGQKSQYGHPDEEAVKIYMEKAVNEQVYTTNALGTFVGFISRDNRWTVSRTSFTPSESTEKNSFQIGCNYDFGENKNIPGASDGDFKIGSGLKFYIKTHDPILEPSTKVDIWWEVSNGGINDDHEHQEIYYKGNHENTSKYNFDREVSYEGKHLLRCRIRNRERKIDITRIFVVNGVKR